MDASTFGLFLSVVISAVGAGLFIFGRKQGRLPQMLGGVALCVYPYFVSNLWLMGGIAILVIAAVAVAVRLGA